MKKLEAPTDSGVGKFGFKIERVKERHTVKIIRLHQFLKLVELASRFITYRSGIRAGTMKAMLRKLFPDTEKE